MMQKEIGDKSFPICLLGDSNPTNWEGHLTAPFDSRHPARHNIWTPSLDNVQDHVFRLSRTRIETRSLYIRNAIEGAASKPKPNQLEWNEKVQQEISEFKQKISEYRPVFIFSFGAFAFEFARRSANTGHLEEKPFKDWTTLALGNQFKQRTEYFNVSATNVIPLLHATIARGRFMTSHHHFCEKHGDNYFDFVGQHIARLVMQYCEQLPIWIK